MHSATSDSQLALDFGAMADTIGHGPARQGGMPLRIREYSPADKDACIDLGARMHAESRYAHMTYSPVTVSAMLDVIDGVRLAGFLAERDDAIIGFACVTLQPHFFTYGKSAHDLALYVVPEHRNTLAFPGLLRACERWARKSDASSIVMGITAPHDAERVARAYRKLGYSDFGLVMRKEF